MDTANSETLQRKDVSVIGLDAICVDGDDTAATACQKASMNMLALTDIPAEDLKKLLRHVHRGELPCPITADTLACVGLQYRGEPILAALRGLEEAGVRAVLISVLAERRVAEEASRRTLPQDRHPHVVNDQHLTAQSLGDGETPRLQFWRLGAAAGGERIGARLVALAPRHRSWPHHAHSANEEALYILEGHPILRIDEQRIPLEPGDYVALPANTAHQLINQDEPARYLCLSTEQRPDVLRYPDSEQIDVLDTSAERTHRFFVEHAISTDGEAS